ncbi:hypothetical protein K432DRAFT_408023 [Lepidopterella palustris CBS 459.81]|uniref:Uncharacterized protein n=1 Tax=Lepidopterella palustris CBS 459.81 TaxID=1314670 RepID=A0A8E2E3H7_9PEZI|nr:hypothetical protein K432DRAFT_408023 [Lepidopterella palustris CBS 459.81]
MADGNVKNLKLIYSCPVENTETNGDIQQALANANKPHMQYDGRVKFPMEIDEGKALLASANGRGVPWMLINHRAKLGIETVESVIVFRNDGSGGDGRVPSLIFILKDV